METYFFADFAPEALQGLPQRCKHSSNACSYLEGGKPEVVQSLNHETKSKKAPSPQPSEKDHAWVDEAETKGRMTRT